MNFQIDNYLLILEIFFLGIFLTKYIFNGLQLSKLELYFNSVLVGISIGSVIVFFAKFLQLNIHLCLLFFLFSLLLIKSKSFYYKSIINLNFIYIIPIIYFIISFHYQGLPLEEWDSFAIWKTKASLFINDFNCINNKDTQFIPHFEYPPFYSAILTFFYTENLKLALKIICLLSICFFSFRFVYDNNKQYANYAIPLVLSSVFLINNIYYGYVDCWISLFILISLFYQSKHSENQKFLLISTFFAGIASLYKNEGIAFFILVSILNLYLIKNSNSRIKNFIVFLPFIFIAVFWKYYVSLNSGFFSDFTFSNFYEKLMNIDRHVTLITYCFKKLLLSLEFIFINVSLLFMSLHSKKMQSYQKIPILFYLFFYYFAYILTNWEQLLHLRSSAERIYIQILPYLSVLLLSCLKSMPKKG